MDGRLGRLLIAVHVVLGLWAAVGFAEWFVSDVPWPRISNPLFPRDVLFAQWALSLGAAVLFLAGYARRWPWKPAAMAVVYTLMALLCAVQTFTWMEGTMRFVAMGAEYVAYAVILGVLFRSERYRATASAAAAG
jgi:hypothetical protein